jgi:hypothetical protein
MGSATDIPNGVILEPLTSEAFYYLRNRILAERKQLIALRHESERQFFGERRLEHRR